MMWHQRADVVVVGTGVAGLVAALAAHRRGRKVVVLEQQAASGQSSFGNQLASAMSRGGASKPLPEGKVHADAGARRSTRGQPGCQLARERPTGPPLV